MMNQQKLDYFLKQTFPLYNDKSLKEHFTRVYKTLELIWELPKDRIIDIGGHPVFPLSHCLKNLIESKDFAQIDQSFIDLEKTKLPYPKDYFDLAVFCEVIEHLRSDPAHALSEINRIIKINGNMILSTPNSHSLLSLFQFLKGNNPSLYPVYSQYLSHNIHSREYSSQELFEILEKHGFEVISHKTIDVYKNSKKIPHNFQNVIKDIKQDYPQLIQHDLFQDKNFGDTHFFLVKKIKHTSPNYNLSIYTKNKLSFKNRVAIKVRRFYLLKETIKYPIRLIKKLLNKVFHKS